MTVDPQFSQMLQNLDNIDQGNETKALKNLATSGPSEIQEMGNILESLDQLKGEDKVKKSKPKRHGEQKNVTRGKLVGENSKQSVLGRIKTMVEENDSKESILEFIENALDSITEDEVSNTFSTYREARESRIQGQKIFPSNSVLWKEAKEEYHPIFEHDQNDGNRYAIKYYQQHGGEWIVK